MTASDFHTDWITLGAHRVQLRCRSSFPTDRMKLLAQFAVEICNNNSNGDALVYEVFLDDKSSTYAFGIASTDASDADLQDLVADIFAQINGYNNFVCHVEIVPGGNRDSENYEHAEHLRLQVELLHKRRAALVR